MLSKCCVCLYRLIEDSHTKSHLIIVYFFMFDANFSSFKINYTNIHDFKF